MKKGDKMNERIPYKFTIRQPGGNIVEMIRMESTTSGIKGEIIECRLLTKQEMEQDIQATKDRIRKFRKDKGYNE